MTHAFFGTAAHCRRWVGARRAARVLPACLLLAAAVAALGVSASCASQVVPAATLSAPPDREAAVPARARCQTCGVVEAIRVVDAPAGDAATYEFVVRLHDGSARTSTSVGKGSWRVGDRIQVLGGEGND